MSAVSSGVPAVWQVAAALLGWVEAILIGDSGNFQGLQVKALKLPPQSGKQIDASVTYHLPNIQDIIPPISAHILF